jgi:putative flippase GtrA
VRKGGFDPFLLGNRRRSAYGRPMSPSPVLSRLSPAQTKLLAELFRFGAVGTLGFVVDTATLYLALTLGAGLYGGRIVSYLAAASANWALNRAWTFRQADRRRPGRQWILFLIVNLFGFVINYGTYALVVRHWPFAAVHPVIGVAAGSIAGMSGNFLLSRRFVFKASQ